MKRRKNIGVLEAKTNLSSILQEVQEGQAFYISRHGHPIAELKPIDPEPSRKKSGFAKEIFSNMSEDFDKPLDDMRQYSE